VIERHMHDAGVIGKRWHDTQVERPGHTGWLDIWSDQHDWDMQMCCVKKDECERRGFAPPSTAVDAQDVTS